MTSLDDRAAFRDLLAILPVADVAKEDLARRMRAPDRFYHSDVHVGAMWSIHVALAVEAGLDGPDARRRIACAVAFHDSVLAPGRADNERRSAELWREASRDAGLPAGDRHAVATMIEATADHVGAVARPEMNGRQERELCWVLDLDLSSLGEAPSVFTRNTADLRRESAHLGERAWQESLVRFFSRLLMAQPLYRCRPIASRLEFAARANMTHALQRLSTQLADAT